MNSIPVIQGSLSSIRDLIRRSKEFTRRPIIRDNLSRKEFEGIVAVGASLREESRWENGSRIV